MPWLLDGNNLAKGRARERVRRAALDLARRQRVKVLVVFDGAPPEGGEEVEHLGQVEVRYTHHADMAILAVLGQSGGGWRVATDDRELARRARDAGAEVVAREAFWRRVADQQRQSSPASTPLLPWQEEMEFFKDPRNRLMAPVGRVRRRSWGAQRRR